MTALEAFRTSADADVYFRTDTGAEVFVETGMQTASGLALKVVDGHGRRYDYDIPADRMLTVNVYR